MASARTVAGVHFLLFALLSGMLDVSGFYVGRQSKWNLEGAAYGSASGSSGTIGQQTIIAAAVHGNYTYLFNAIPLRVQDAAQECEAAGGVLPTGDTGEEKAFIQAVFQSLLDAGILQTALSSTVRWLVNYNETSSGGNGTYAVYEVCEGYLADPQVNCNGTFRLQPLYAPPYTTDYQNCSQVPYISSSQNVWNETTATYDQVDIWDCCQAKCEPWNFTDHPGCDARTAYFARVGHICKVREPAASEYQHPDLAGVLAISRYICPTLDILNITTNPCMCDAVTCATVEGQNRLRVTGIRLSWPQLNYPDMHYPPLHWHGMLPYLKNLEITSYSSFKQQHLLQGYVLNPTNMPLGNLMTLENDVRAVVCNATMLEQYDLYYKYRGSSYNSGYQCNASTVEYSYQVWCYHMMPKTSQIPDNLASIAPNLQSLRISYNDTDGISACWQTNLSSSICKLSNLQKLHISTGGGFSQRWTHPASRKLQTTDVSPIQGGSSLYGVRYQHSTARSDGCPQRLQKVMLGCIGDLSKLQILNITIPGGRRYKEFQGVNTSLIDLWSEHRSMNGGYEGVQKVYGRGALVGAYADNDKTLQAYNVPAEVPWSGQARSYQPSYSSQPYGLQQWRGIAYDPIWNYTGPPVYMPAHNDVPPYPATLPAEWAKLSSLKELHIMPSMVSWLKARRAAFEKELPYTGSGYNQYQIRATRTASPYGSYSYSSLYRCERNISSALGPLQDTAVGYRSNYTETLDGESDLAYQISTRFAPFAFPNEASSWAPLAGIVWYNNPENSDTQYTEVLNANLYSPGWSGLTGSGSSEWFPVVGSIPLSYYSGMRNLTKLALPALQLNGTLAEDLSKWQDLQHLDLAYNPGVKGALPESLSNCTQLRHLFLQQNSITGSIPAAYARLQNLQHVNLAWNQLTGNFPAWPSMPMLREVHFTGNKLGGPLPGGVYARSSTEKFKLWVMQTFAVGKGDKSDTSGLRGWPELRLMCINDNDLQGNIPDSWRSDLCTRQQAIRVDAANNALAFDYVDNTMSRYQYYSLSDTSYNHQRASGCSNPNAMQILIILWSAFGGIVVLILVATVWRIGLNFRSKFAERKKMFKAILNPRKISKEDMPDSPSIVNELQSWLKASRYAGFALSLYYGFKACLLIYDIGSDVLVILQMWPNQWLWFFFGGLCAPSVVGAICTHVYLSRKARWMADNWVPEQYRDMLPEDHPGRKMQRIAVYSAIAEGALPCDFLAYFLFPLLVILTLPLMMIKFVTVGRVQLWYARQIDGVKFLFLYHLLVGLVEAPMSAAVLTVIYTMPVDPNTPTYLSDGLFIINIVSSMVDMLCMWYSIHEMAVSGNSFLAIFRMFARSCYDLGPDGENLTQVIDVAEVAAAAGVESVVANIQLSRNKADHKSDSDSPNKAQARSNSTNRSVGTKQPAVLSSAHSAEAVLGEAGSVIDPQQVQLTCDHDQFLALHGQVAALASEAAYLRAEVADIKAMLSAAMQCIQAGQLARAPSQADNGFDVNLRMPDLASAMVGSNSPTAPPLQGFSCTGLNAHQQTAVPPNFAAFARGIPGPLAGHMAACTARSTSCSPDMGQSVPWLAQIACANSTGGEQAASRLCAASVSNGYNQHATAMTFVPGPSHLETAASRPATASPVAQQLQPQAMVAAAVNCVPGQQPMMSRLAAAASPFSGQSATTTMVPAASSPAVLEQAVTHAASANSNILVGQAASLAMPGQAVGSAAWNAPGNNTPTGPPVYRQPASDNTSTGR